MGSLRSPGWSAAAPGELFIQPAAHREFTECELGTVALSSFSLWSVGHNVQMPGKIRIILVVRAEGCREKKQEFSWCVQEDFPGESDDQSRTLKE